MVVVLTSVKLGKACALVKEPLFSGSELNSGDRLAVMVVVGGAAVDVEGTGSTGLMLMT